MCDNMRPEQNLHDYSFCQVASDVFARDNLHATVPNPIPNSNRRLTNRFCPLTSQLSGQQRSEPMNPSPDFQPPTPAASYPRFLSAKNNVGIWVRRYAYREDLSSRQICRLLALRLLPRGSPNCQRQFLSPSLSDGPSRCPNLFQMAPSEVFPSGFSPRGAPICFRWPLPRISPLSQMALRLLEMVSLESSHALIQTCFRWPPFRGPSLCHRWPAPLQVVGSIVVQLSRAASQGHPGHKRSPGCPTG